MKCPSYPAYRPSGIIWLGDAPEHWETGNLRRFARMKTGHTPSRQHPEYWEDCTIPWFGLADVWQLRDDRRTYLGETKEMISDVGLRNSAAELLPAGTVVLSRTASVGFSGIMPVPMATTQDFWNWVCGPKLLPGYLLLLFRAMRKELERSTMGSTHKTIYQEDAAALGVCVPPLPEQHAIVDFVDRQTARIDTLVDKKRVLIEKLKEKRAALISRTVTRGLPPDGLHAAGLGMAADRLDGPAQHRKMKPLMHITDPARPIMYGIVLPGPDVDEGVPIVKGGDVKPGRLTLDDLCRTTFEIEAGYARSRLKANDVVFSIRGSVGEAELVPQEIEGANLTQDVARIAPGKGINARWLLYAVKADSVVAPLLALSLGAAVRDVNIRDLKRVNVGVPSSAEQCAIADFLDKETNRIDGTLAAIRAAIRQLLEYRAAIIISAVSGQIDVRDFIKGAQSPPALCVGSICV